MNRLRLIITFIAIFAMGRAMAQDDALLNRIEKANAGVKLNDVSFVEVRHPAGQSEKTVEGTIMYDAAAGLKMDYTNPKGEYFIINGTQMTLLRDGHEAFFDLTKNKPMKSLAELLTSSFNGTLTRLAEANNANLTVKEVKEGIVATLEAKKKAVRGYAKVVLTYDVKSLHLVNMVMEEFDGSVTTYRMK